MRLTTLGLTPIALGILTLGAAACGSSGGSASSTTSTTSAATSTTSAASSKGASSTTAPGPVICAATVTTQGPDLIVTVHTIGPAVVYVTDKHASPSSVEHTIGAAGPAKVTAKLRPVANPLNEPSPVQVKVFSHRKSYGCTATKT